MQSQAIVFTALNEARLQNVEIPAPGKGQVVVEIHYSCLSPGTELRVLAGREEGAPAFPFVPGYSASGIVCEVGAQTSLREGTPVFLTGGARSSLPNCWGAHIRHAVVAEKALYPLPVTLSLRSASALKLLAIAYHGMKLGGCQPGERVAVLGLGPIGFFSALLHQAAGAEVVVSDLLPQRTTLAKQKGLTLLAPSEIPFEKGADIVVDATGAPSVLAQACTFLRERPWDHLEHPRTRLLIQGSYATPPPLPYHILFHREPQVWIPRDHQRQDVEEVIQLLKEGLLSINDLLADLGSPDRAAEVYSDVSTAVGNAVTGVFHWQEGESRFRDSNP